MLATVNDFEARLGVPADSLEAEDLARAEAVLADASAVVASIGLPSWTEGTVPEVARVVVLRLARKLWENPEGVSYEALGDHTVSRAAARQLLTEDERDLVMDAAGFSTGVYSIRTPGVWS